MSKIDEVMKAWQEDHKEVSWSDLQAIKEENQRLRAQLSEKNIGQGEPGAWWYNVLGKIHLETSRLDNYYVVNGEYIKGRPLIFEAAKKQGE